jgi:hypothetical protein
MLSDLETEGRMARILVSVDDPLGLQSKTQTNIPPMLIGEYVRVEIEGQRLENVYRIPRSALRDDSTIWTLTETDTLKIVSVEAVWRDASHVLMKNSIVPGQRLIVSDLSTAVDGMDVRDETLAPSGGKAANQADAKRENG